MFGRFFLGGYLGFSLAGRLTLFCRFVAGKRGKKIIWFRSGCTGCSAFNTLGFFVVFLFLSKPLLELAAVFLDRFYFSSSTIATKVFVNVICHWASPALLAKKPCVVVGTLAAFGR